ncbi:hypothetical protein SNE40_014175 [Patella caerulea]|uniref:FAM194 C-terminal domain-containing protein n=1 Tax=Patella caerulea TaxID=87958 RepID=A0AAN8PIP6_PATCE
MQHRYSKEQGYDKPVQVRYYGDSRMETLIKYRKSPVKQELNPALHGQKPCIPSLLDDKNEDKKLMLSGHSDGTIVVHYPSGRTAIIHSSSGYGRPGCYTIAYDDSDDMKMLAYFTPSGIGCVYHSNGTVRFLATNMGGHLAEKDGSVTRKWKWPAANVKIANPLSLQVGRNYYSFVVINAH